MTVLKNVVSALCNAALRHANRSAIVQRIVRLAVTNAAKSTINAARRTLIMCGPVATRNAGGAV